MKRSLSAEGVSETDILGWTHRCALELIGQGGIGYSFDPLIERRPNEYATALKNFVLVILLYQATKSEPMTSIRPALFALSVPRFVWYKFDPLFRYVPSSWKRWVVDHPPSKRLQHMKNICDTLERNACNILQMKKNALIAGEEAMVKQVGEGKDILSLLRI